MAQVIRKQKGASGFPNVGYRHVDGQVFPALIVSASALGVPGAPTVNVVGAAGAASYSYRITALTVQGETTVGTAGTTATGNAALTGSNFNRVTWTAVAGATGYRVYGRTGGSELLMATIQVTTPGGSTKVGGGVINVNASGNGFEDTGTVTPAGAQPGANTASTYTIRVPSLRQGPSGGTNWQKTGVSVASLATHTDALVVGR